MRNMIMICPEKKEISIHAFKHDITASTSYKSRESYCHIKLSNPWNDAINIQSWVHEP